MKEKKVYVLNLDAVDDGFDFKQLEQIGDKEAIKKEAIRLENAWSLEDFADACNDEYLDLGNSFILID